MHVSVTPPPPPLTLCALLSTPHLHEVKPLCVIVTLSAPRHSEQLKSAKTQKYESSRTHGGRGDEVITEKLDGVRKETFEGQR